MHLVEVRRGKTNKSAPTCLLLGNIIRKHYKDPVKKIIIIIIIIVNTSIDVIDSSGAKLRTILFRGLYFTSLKSLF